MERAVVHFQQAVLEVAAHHVEGEIIGGEAAPSRETLEVGFFAPDKLPPLSVSRNLDFQIHRMFEHAKNPSLATDFD